MCFQFIFLLNFIEFIKEFKVILEWKLIPHSDINCSIFQNLLIEIKSSLNFQVLFFLELKKLFLILFLLPEDLVVWKLDSRKAKLLLLSQNHLGWIIFFILHKNWVQLVLGDSSFVDFLMWSQTNSRHGKSLAVQKLLLRAGLVYFLEFFKFGEVGLYHLK